MGFPQVRNERGAVGVGGHRPFPTEANVMPSDGCVGPHLAKQVALYQTPCPAPCFWEREQLIKHGTHRWGDQMLPGVTWTRPRVQCHRSLSLPSRVYCCND